MNMKKLIESIDECGAMPAQPPQDQGNPVTMSVNLSATGKQHVDDLVKMMQNAGLGDAKPMSTDMMPMRSDMEKFRSIVDSEEITNEGSGSFEDVLASMPKDVEQFKRTGDMSDDLYQAAYDFMFQKGIQGGRGDPYEQVADFVSDYVDVDEGYDNEPDEDYRDTNYMTKDLSGGINREKRMYKASQRGDNAMTAESIRDQLYKTLSEKKAKPDYLDLDKDGDKKEPMKKAAADKKKGAVGKKIKEQQVDEISKETLRSYWKKAGVDASNLYTKAHHISNQNQEKKSDKLSALAQKAMDKSDKRVRGHNQALRKLSTKEAYEMGDDDTQDMQYFNAIAALYGPEIWDNDDMADLAQELADANPSPQDLSYIISKKRLPKHLADIKFSNSDQVQFGEGRVGDFVKKTAQKARNFLKPGASKQQAPAQQAPAQQAPAQQAPAQHTEDNPAKYNATWYGDVPKKFLKGPVDFISPFEPKYQMAANKLYSGMSVKTRKAMALVIKSTHPTEDEVDYMIKRGLILPGVRKKADGNFEESAIDDYLDKKKSSARDTGGRRRHSGSRYGGSAQKPDSDTDAFGAEIPSKKAPARKKTREQQVDELSKDTLQSYLDKSGKSMKTAADYDKRLLGRIKASDRVMKKTDWDSELKKADASRKTKESSVIKTKPVVINGKQVDLNSVEFSIYGTGSDEYDIEDAKFVDGTPLSDQEIEQLYRNETIIDLHQDELQDYHSGSDSKLNRESATNEASDYMNDLLKFAKVVRSVETPEQLKVAQRMGSNLLQKYRGMPTSKLDKVSGAMGYGTFGSDLDRHYDVEDELYRKTKDLGLD